MTTPPTASLALIDTHAHLTDPVLDGRLETVLAQAAQAGVVGIVTVATDVATARLARQQAQTWAGRLPRLYPTAGVHPGYVQGLPPDWADRIAELAADPDCVAVGEIGLDDYHRSDLAALQDQVLVVQLELAARLGKPVIIHTRGRSLDGGRGGGRATDPACFWRTLAHIDEVRRRHRGLRGVFHCFEGDVEQAHAVIARGFAVSFTGTVTYKANAALREVVAGLPGDRLMVETDAPYLSPEPVRQVRPCVPGMVLHTASCLAATRGMPLIELAAATTATARAVFGLPG